MSELPDPDEVDLLPEEKKYSLVEIDMTSDVKDAGRKKYEFDDISEVKRHDTDYEMYLVYEADGTSHRLSELRE